jgi:hypothetical protein
MIYVNEAALLQVSGTIDICLDRLQREEIVQVIRVESACRKFSFLLVSKSPTHDLEFPLLPLRTDCGWFAGIWRNSVGLRERN